MRGPILRCVSFVAIALLTFGMFAGAVGARELTGAERDGLKAQVSRFNDAMGALNFDILGATIPPKFLDHIARSAGISVDKLKQALGAQMRQALAAVTIVDFRMEADKADYRATPDGTPYALIPTVTLMDVSGTRMEASSSTLALIDSGKWYLLRIDDPNQLEVLRAVYPAFAKVDVPPGTTRKVD